MKPGCGLLEQSFFDAHPNALMLTPTGNYRIDFFAGYVANVKVDAWQVDFGPDEFDNARSVLLAKIS